MKLIYIENTLVKKYLHLHIVAFYLYKHNVLTRQHWFVQKKKMKIRIAHCNSVDISCWNG